MKNSKLFTLVSHLPVKDSKVFGEAIAGHKRGSLKKLYNTLLAAGNETEPAATEVYKEVFGKKYTKANDYLLRNEYRLLYDWLQEQIINQPDTSGTGLTVYMRYLLHINAYGLFEDEYSSVWKKAQNDDDIDLLVQLCDLNLQYYLTGKPQTLPNAEMMAQLSQQRIDLLQRQLLRNVRKEEIRLKMAERIITAYRSGDVPTPKLTAINLQLLEDDDLYARYLSRRAQVNFARGNEKINLLKEILDEEQVIHKYEPAPEEAICRFWVNLGQEYYLNMNFAEAVKHYARAYSYWGKVPGAVRETLILNYIMCLMRSENIKLAESLAAEHAALMLNSRILTSRAPFLLAVVNLYARNADAAEKYVDFESKKDGSEFYYFMRLVLSAVYYLRGDTGLALREAINLDQAVNYELQRSKTIQTQISKPIITWFRRYYTLVQSNKPGMAADLKKLLGDIEQTAVPNNDQSPNSMLTQWLLKEIQGRTKKAK